MRLPFLAPDIVEAILDGRQTAGVTLEALLGPWPAEWIEERLALGLTQ